MSQRPAPSVENDAALEPGQTYYIEHGWSGCAGSVWGTLPQAAKDGWAHAERWERKFREAQAEIAQVKQVCRELDTRPIPPAADQGPPVPEIPPASPEQSAPEVRVEWGIAWHFLASPQPYPDEESARRLVQSYLDNPDALEGDPMPVAVRRTVTAGPWTRVSPPAGKGDGRTPSCEKDAGSLALVCPYCGATLTINQETEGRTYLTYEVPESIECDASDCGATWEPNGEPRDAPQWQRYPDLYAAPARAVERAGRVFPPA